MRCFPAGRKRTKREFRPYVPGLEDRQLLSAIAPWGGLKPPYPSPPVQASHSPPVPVCPPAPGRTPIVSNTAVGATSTVTEIVTANTTVINSANADVNVSPRVVVSQPTYAQVTPVGHGVGTIGNAAHGATSNVVVHVNENITVVGSDNATINVEPSIVVSQPTHSMATVARHA